MVRSPGEALSITMETAFLTSPEVFDELPEGVCPLGQRYDDVDEDAARVHRLTLNLHHGTERPEEHQLSEAP